MANKLTKKKIDLLIEQVLSEVSITDFKIDDWEAEPVELPLAKGAIDNYNAQYQPDPKAPDPYKKATDYKAAIKNLASGDGKDDDLSYKDVLQGLKSTNPQTKALSQNLRKGSKFKQQFDFAILNHSITKICKDNEMKINKEHAKFETDDEIVSLIPLGDIITKIQKRNRDLGGDDEYEVDLEVKDYIKKNRKTGPAGNFAKILNSKERKHHNDQVVIKLTTILDGGNAPEEIQKKAYIYANSEFTVTGTKKTALKNSLKTKYDYIEIGKSINYDPEDYSFPSDEKPPQQTTARSIDSPVGSLQISYSGLSPQGATFDQASSTLSGKISVDPSFVATVNAIEGTNMMDKIANLAEFANDIENKLSEMEVGKASSYLRMLGFLSDAAREYEDASAGTVFETFLAAAGQGIIIGGESGAADVVTMAGGNPVYYSAKLYSSKAIEQSDQANIGFRAVAQKAVQDRPKTGLIYVIGIKTNLSKDILTAAKNISFGKTKTLSKIGEASRPKAIAMCVLNIIPKDDGYDVYAISGAKKYKLKSSVLIKEEEEDKAKKAHLGDLVQEVASNNLWHSYVPIFFDVKGALQSASASGAVSIKTAIEKWGSETLKKLAKAFANLREMDLLAQEHTAKQGELTVEQHMTFINNIETNRTNFKTNYSSVSDEINPEKNKKDISETKSLKELDKLIEHVILNKMNK